MTAISSILFVLEALFIARYILLLVIRDISIQLRKRNLYGTIMHQYCHPIMSRLLDLMSTFISHIHMTD